VGCSLRYSLQTFNRARYRVYAFKHASAQHGVGKFQLELIFERNHKRHTRVRGHAGAVEIRRIDDFVEIQPQTRVVPDNLSNPVSVRTFRRLRFRGWQHDRHTSVADSPSDA